MGYLNASRSAVLASSAGFPAVYHCRDSRDVGISTIDQSIASPGRISGVYIVESCLSYSRQPSALVMEEHGRAEEVHALSGFAGRLPAWLHMGRDIILILSPT